MRRRFVVLVDDVMARSRITSAAPADAALLFPTSEAELLQLLEPPPTALIVGLATTSLPWERLVRLVRERQTAPGVPIIAFGPHRDLALRQRALAAGVDRVMASSAFVAALPRLLRGELLGPPDAPASPDREPPPQPA